jgi:integrase/recombinase XerD
VAGYLSELKRHGRSEATAILYRRALRRLGAFLSERGVKVLADISAEHLVVFRDRELARRAPGKDGPLAAGTVSITLAGLRGFFGYVVRQGLLLLDASADLEGPRTRRALPRDVPTARQMRKLIAQPDQSARGLRDRAILELLYGAGLRNAELCGLGVGDVDLARRMVFVRKGKGGKERVVPLGKKAREALSGYLAERPSGVEALFLTYQGRPMTTQAVRRLVASYRGAARLKTRVTPHSLRHACATHLLRGGAGIRQIQVLLGHASLKSTEVYTRVEPTDLLRMLDRHHPRSLAELPEDD